MLICLGSAQTELTPGSSKPPSDLANSFAVVIVKQLVLYKQNNCCTIIQKAKIACVPDLLYNLPG